MAESLPGMEWQCVPAAATEDRKLGWLNSACEEGAAWLRSQRGYSDFSKALDVFAGKDRSVTTASYRSRLSVNRLKRNVREVTGTLAKLRPMWGYYSENDAYRSSAELMNKVARAWYLKRRVDRSVKDALSWAAATGRGWARPVYRRDRHGTGHGDIYLDTYGAPSVLPVQLPASGDWQEAYAVTILDEMPVAKAHGMFPQFQDRLRPTSSRYWYQNDSVRRASQGNWLQRAFGMFKRDQTRNELSDLLIPIRRTWVLDLTINKTGSPIPMGEPGSSWAYNVPSVGQDIFVGLDLHGNKMYRKADENDARLYPNRRLLISTPDVMLYDGPAFDWHGMFPAVSFALDSYPWEPAGFSLVHDGFEINESQKEIYRGCMDKIRAQLRPSVAFDTNAVAMNEARAFDPMQPDARIGYDGSTVEKQPFQQVMDPAALEITPQMLEYLKILDAALDSQMAINDVMALAQARAASSMGDLEKMMEANHGPIIEDMSRSMEAPMADLGEMVKYDFLQYYNVPRVMQIVGPEGMTLETFDYDPASMVPSHLQGESAEGPSPTSQSDRARILARNLEFYILPNTLHELTQMQMKLGLIQLRKAGLMIDSQTIAEAWQVPNFGTIEGNTVIERFRNEKQMELELAARMQEVAKGLNLGQPPGAAGAGKQPEGRPPSGNAPPKLQSKDNGTRSSITESR